MGGSDSQLNLMKPNLALFYQRTKKRVSYRPPGFMSNRSNSSFYIFFSRENIVLPPEQIGYANIVEREHHLNGEEVLVEEIRKRCF